MDKEEVRVLIVEDDEDNRQALTLMVELDGYHVRAVATGEEALPLVRSYQPAVVLVDLGLPGMDGVELTRRLREGLTTELVIIAITGATCDGEQERLEAAGVDFVLFKPLGDNQLRRFLPPL